MKRILLLLIAAIALVLPVAPARAESTLLNGQTQYYTVQLRTDKRAIVYARIIFENPSSSDNLSTYEFSLPSGVSVQDLSAQQILAKSTDTPDCKTYVIVQKGVAYKDFYDGIAAAVIEYESLDDVATALRPHATQLQHLL